MEDPTAEGAVDQGGSDTSSSGGCNSSVRFRKVKIGFPDELGPEMEEEDLELPMKPNFSLEDKLTADKFNKPSFIKEYQGSDLTISLFLPLGSPSCLRLRKTSSEMINMHYILCSI